jgi:hypothetical protein
MLEYKFLYQLAYVFDFAQPSNNQQLLWQGNFRFISRQYRLNWSSIAFQETQFIKMDDPNADTEWYWRENPYKYLIRCIKSADV